MALVSLVVLGLWMPLLWIGAAIVLALMVFYGVGLARARSRSAGEEAPSGPR